MKKEQTLINLLSSILGYARNITTTWSKGGKSDILNVHCDPFFNKISFFIIYVINWYYYTMNCITNQVFFLAFTAFVQYFYNSLHICKGRRLLAIYYVKFLKVFSLRSPGYSFHLFLEKLIAYHRYSVTHYLWIGILVFPRSKKRYSGSHRKCDRSCWW